MKKNIGGILALLGAAGIFIGGYVWISQTQAKRNAKVYDASQIKLGRNVFIIGIIALIAGIVLSKIYKSPIY